MPENLPNRQTTEYQVTRTKILLPGLVQMPVAGPDGTACKIVKLHAPLQKEIVAWTAVCEGGPPVVPSPIGSGSPLGLNANLILLKETISGIIPSPKADGGHVFAMSGIYEYGLLQAESPTSDLKLGSMPWENAPGVNYFPAGNFSTSVLDTTVVPTQGAVPLLNPIQGP